MLYKLHIKVSETAQ